MRRRWTKFFKAGRLILERLRLMVVRLQYGQQGFPDGLCIAAGVRVSVTDGGSAAFAPPCDLDRNATILVKTGCLSVGERTYIGIGSVICARESIRIGRDVLIAEYVTIRDQDHAFGRAAATADSGFTTAPIVIGNNVWLGAKVTVTKGVTIGDNTVIGANSVVTKDIPANVLAAGVPALVIRALRPDDRTTDQSVTGAGVAA